jgi:hypothetical protein
MKFQYTEGPKAQENFEQGMKALFKVPKDAVMPRKKNAKQRRATSRKPKRPDKD